jgi:hypothetical protein
MGYFTIMGVEDLDFQLVDYKRISKSKGNVPGGWRTPHLARNFFELFSV